MTAQIVELFPTGGHADDTIRRTVDALAKGKGMTREQVAERAGIKRSTFFYKMSGHGADRAFKGGEVADLARALGVTVGQLFDGLGGTFVPPDHTPTGAAGQPTQPYVASLLRSVA